MEDKEGYDSPHDLAWSLRDFAEDSLTLKPYPIGADYVTSVARGTRGHAFLVKYQTGKTLRVEVTAAEPSPRFYPEEGEPDERERKEFEETFKEVFGAPLSPEDIKRIKEYTDQFPKRKLHREEEK